MSVDYYTRLEQGRSRSASTQVLDAIAGALRLDDAERAHLHTIARPSPVRRRRSTPQRLHPATSTLLTTLDTAFRPAFVLGRWLRVLGQNQLAALLIADFATMPTRDRNQARFVFLEPHARELYVDWDEVATDTVAMLRMDAGRHPDDPELGLLVGELSIRSPEFRSLWARHLVHQRSTGTKRYRPPPGRRSDDHLPGAHPRRRSRADAHDLRHRTRFGLEPRTAASGHESRREH